MDFDRSIGTVHVGGGNREIAFDVHYWSDRMTFNDPNRGLVDDRLIRKDPSWPVYEFAVIARCTRSGASWSCREDDLGVLAKQLNVPSTTRDEIDRLIERLLK